MGFEGLPVPTEETRAAERLAQSYNPRLAQQGLGLGADFAARLGSPDQITEQERKSWGKILRALQKSNHPDARIAETIQNRIAAVMGPTDHGNNGQPRNALPPLPRAIAEAPTIEGGIPPAPTGANGGAGETRKDGTIIPIPGGPRGGIPERPSGLGHGGLSLNQIGQAQRAEAIGVLGDQLIPAAEHYADDPQVAERLLAMLQQQSQDVVKGVFAHFSAQGMALPIPHHLLGKALLLMHERVPAFTKWVEEGQQDRLGWLGENVRHTAADIDAPRMIAGFQEHHLKAQPNQAALDQLLSGLDVHMQGMVEHAPETITRIAQLFTEQLMLSNANRVMAESLLRNSRPLASSGRMPDEMLSALVALNNKIMRLRAQEAAQAAPKSEAEVFPDADDMFADFDPPAFADLGKQEEDEEEDPLIIHGKKMTEAEVCAAADLAELIQNHSRMFVRDYLRPELELHGPNLHLMVDPQCASDPEEDDIPILGAGGTSVVVRLFSTKFQRPVAVRFDVHGLTNDRNAELAIRGFAIHGKLVHPNIARSFGFNSLPMQITPKTGTDKTPQNVALTYQEVELIENGVGLDKVIWMLSRPDSIGVPKPEAVINFFYRVLNALEFCHGMNVVHRDIKPDNIMIVPPPGWNGDLNDLLERGKPKILDFGIAKDTSQGDSGHTYSGSGILGTPYYIDPHGCRKASNTRHPAADVYALAMTFFDLVTGQRKEHPIEHSRYGETHLRRATANHINMAAAIGKIQPGEPPIISKQNPLFAAFLSQGGPIAEAFVDRLVEMSDPDRAKRPSTRQLLAFAEAPLNYSPDQDHSPRTSRLRRSSAEKPRGIVSRVAGSVVENVKAGWKKVFG